MVKEPDIYDYIRDMLNGEVNNNIGEYHYPHITLGVLIDWLERQDPNAVVKHGMVDPHSYRGIYSDLAFQPKLNVSFGQMLNEAKRALGNVYHGYKGGEYEVDNNTPVWIDSYSYGNGMPVTPALLALWRLEAKSE